MDIACRGTGLHNAAVLRALDSAGRIEVVMSRVGPTLREPTAMGFSRSLLTTASQGVLAEMSATSTGDFSQSIIQMNVDAAICVPLMLGSTVAASISIWILAAALTLPDAAAKRGGFLRRAGKDRRAGMANLKRLDIERRSAQIEAELKAAMAAQRWILPRGKVYRGSFVCAGTSRPGEYVGGDFFRRDRPAGQSARRGPGRRFRPQRRRFGSDAATRGSFTPPSLSTAIWPEPSRI